VSKNETGLKNY